jgi:serine/threonine-protein kinase ULK4
VSLLQMPRTQADSGLQLVAVEQLRHGLQDSSSAVRRRTMVTVGELLFYLCNEGRDTPARAMETARRTWPNAAAVAEDMCGVLRTGEDPVTQHYAAKALDNIMTRDGFWPTMLATEHTATALLQVCDKLQH